MPRTMDDYYTAVYWGCRVESAEECARRAETFFRLLSRCAPDYSCWFEQADSRKKALQLRFEPTAEMFVRFFKRRGYRLGKIGFTFGAWTGHEEDERGGVVSFICGDDAMAAPNNCILYLPKEEPGTERVLTTSVLREVIRAMVLAWEPDDGGVFSDAYQELRNEPVGPPRTGWLMYFSRRRGEVPPLPEPVRTEPVEDKGTLVILTPERFNGHDPAHVALADQVRGLLDRAGLLKELG
ncbi:immunity 52 family protein [Archangium sp.]|uniref:immunity 52 family protein n=1 Tax=Archangium sp. TaxID=1872627 RepID=UPI002D3D4CE9|nr:immunity 52 family protein [Archangium sp.]HYO55341.1 immunity 52 family protein [Archangium sp.]